MTDPRPEEAAKEPTEDAAEGGAEERDGTGPVAGVSSRDRWRRIGAIAAVVIVAVLLPLWGRAALDGAAELSRADDARARGDASAEIEHLGRALRWRAPLRSHDEVALERLWSIGTQAQAEGELDRALVAFREIRRGLLATRAWGIPHRERFDAANDRIATLMSRQQERLGLTEAGAAEPEATHRAWLERIPGPDPTRGRLAALAFIGWLGTVVGFCLWGIDPRGRLHPRPALRWGTAAVALLVAWAVLLATAHA